MAASGAVFILCKKTSTIDNRPVKNNRITLPHLEGKKEDELCSSISLEPVQFTLKPKTNY